MTEKTIEKTYEITNTVKTYIAEDGKEFSDMDKCIIYENELDLNHYANKYKMKFISVPTFVCSGDDKYVYGISFYFPQDGNEDELKKLLTIYQNYNISENGEKWKIDWVRNLNNVRDSNFEIKIPLLNKRDNYIFYFYWKECYEDYDYFYNQIISKETAMAKLEKEIKEFEEIFGSKIGTVYARGK